MYIIIDAYNLLKTVSHDKTITERQRAQFIKEMAVYAALKKHLIIIVFDGHLTWHNGKLEEIKSHKNVDVIFSGDQSADDYIKQKLQSMKNKDALLVSSDRELNRAANRYDVPSIDAPLFYRMVHDFFKEKVSQKQGSHSVIKTAQSQDESIDQLMCEAAHQKNNKKNDDELNEDGDRKSKMQLSKVERQLLKKIKKL